MDGSLIGTRRTRHEVRDEDGALVAVIDAISNDPALLGPTMIELAADVAAAPTGAVLCGGRGR